MLAGWRVIATIISKNTTRTPSPITLPRRCCLFICINASVTSAPEGARLFYRLSSTLYKKWDVKRTTLQSVDKMEVNKTTSSCPFGERAWCRKRSVGSAWLKSRPVAERTHKFFEALLEGNEENEGQVD